MMTNQVVYKQRPKWFEEAEYRVQFIPFLPPRQLDISLYFYLYLRAILVFLYLCIVFQAIMVLCIGQE